jgi:hypothetical protein
MQRQIVCHSRHTHTVASQKRHHQHSPEAPGTWLAQSDHLQTLYMHLLVLYETILSDASTWRSQEGNKTFEFLSDILAASLMSCGAVAGPCH